MVRRSGVRRDDVSTTMVATRHVKIGQLARLRFKERCECSDSYRETAVEPVLRSIKWRRNAVVGANTVSLVISSVRVVTT